MKPNVLARAAFAAAFLVGQVVLIAQAQSAPDHVFGFQMFNASSDMKISLYRQIRMNDEPYLTSVLGGTWQARDANGVRHTYRWSDRVHDGVLGQLDHFVHASYGLDAQLFRLQSALDDVARYSAADTDRDALIALVETVKNGRERRTVKLVAKP